jgi:hypothetical protein
MAIRFLILVLIGSTPFLGNSQCIDREKITYGGDWDFVPYIFHCPTYGFEYGGDTSSVWSILDPMDLKKIETWFLSIKNNVDRKVREYSGDKFFQRVKFNSVEIVYPDSLQKMLDAGRVDVEKRNCKAKYYFYYEFLPDTISTWHFGIAVDKQGKIISAFTFPKASEYIPVDTNINYCELINIARKKEPNIDPIKEIKLEYDPKVKRFYWLISQEIQSVKEGRNEFNQIAIDAADKSKVNAFKGSAFIQF